MLDSCEIAKAYHDTKYKEAFNNILTNAGHKYEESAWIWDIIDATIDSLPPEEDIESPDSAQRN